MLSVSNTKKVGKIATIIGIFFLAFSSLQPFFEIQIAEAKIVCLNEAGEEVGFAPCLGGTTPKVINDSENSSIGAALGYWVAQIIYVFTVGLGSAVLYVGAALLNFAVNISLDSSAYALDFVSLGWTMLRDLANMAFIFILIYIALKVMFEAHTAGTIGMLAKVLAVALVINFSFFATRVVIDAGNLISVQFYNAVVSDAGGGTVNPIAGVSSGISAPDITKKIMTGINFQTAIGPESFKNISGGGDLADFGAAFIAYAFIYIVLGAMLFMLAAAFVAAGVKFIVRIVMLWFAIITAPLALVAWSFQGGGGHGGGHGGGNYFQKWRNSLISHAFYPAVFLFVMLLISNFMTATTQSAGGFGGGFIQGAITNGVDGSQQGIEAIGIMLANVAVRLGFVIVMLYLALKASDYFEVVGASVAKTWGNNFGFGLPSKLMRFGVGGGSRFIANKIPDQGVGKFARAPLNLLAKSSFDVRGAKVPFTKIGPSTLIEKEFGKPTGKGGWDAFLHDREHKREEKRKAAEKAAQGEIDHHKEGPEVEAREQAAYRAGYAGGAQAFDTRVKELTEEIKKAKEQQTALAKISIDKMDAAARKAHQDRVNTNKTLLKNHESELKNMVEMGHRIVDARNKEHAKEIAIRFIASGNAAKYVVGKKILTGESKESKLAKAVKDYNGEDEQKPADEHKEEAPKNGPGGNPHGPNIGTIDGHANDNHH